MSLAVAIQMDPIESIDIDADSSFALLLEAQGDEEAIASLTKVKGIGRWSAEVYLLFAMGRPDVFPADDLGLMMGAERLKRLNARPSAKALRAMAEDWRPWRAAAARMLWHYRQKAALPEDAD